MQARAAAVVLCLGIAACTCRQPTTAAVGGAVCRSPCLPQSPPAVAPAAPDGTPAAEPTEAARLASLRRQSQRPSATPLQAFPWPQHVTDVEREAIGSLLEDLEWGGRDLWEAADALVAMDARDEDGALKPGERFRAVGRLVSEFKHIVDRFEDIEDPECLARLMTIDTVLRRIDGMQERDFGDRLGIRLHASEREALRVMKRWSWWYSGEHWRIRREPWDLALDLLDPEDLSTEFGPSTVDD